MSYLNHFVFGIYPYIALSIFLLGSLVRFEREQYTWKSDSSQLLYRGQLRLGNILFHIGILGLFFGHLFGLLTPLWIWHALGVSHETKQMVAVVAGGIMGIICLAGLSLLIYRRFTNARISAVTTVGDKVLLLWILGALLLGLATITQSVKHSDGSVMVVLMMWAQHLLTFQGDASTFMLEAPMLFKLHMFMGMTLFVIFPFTRLVHVWSGFGSVTYLIRPWQLVRRR